MSTCLESASKDYECVCCACPYRVYTSKSVYIHILIKNAHSHLARANFEMHHLLLARLVQVIACMRKTISQTSNK